MANPFVTALTLTKPAGVVEGDLMIVAIALGTPDAYSDVRGLLTFVNSLYGAPAN